MICTVFYAICHKFGLVFCAVSRISCFRHFSFVVLVFSLFVLPASEFFFVFLSSRSKSRLMLCLLFF